MGSNQHSEHISGIGEESIRGREKVKTTYNEYFDKIYKEGMPTRLKKLNELTLGQQTAVLQKQYQLSEAALSPTKELANQDDPAIKEINRTLQAQAAAQLISQLYILYMDPGQDAQWRLGITKKVIDDPSIIINDEVMGDTDNHGFIFTPTKFYKKHLLERVGNNGKSEENYYEFGFPPYWENSKNEKVITAQTFIDDKKAEETKKDREKGGTSTYFDYGKHLAYRGNFTYRSANFRNVNETISYIQWLFERVSGISCTYLTDWDLSIYMQENIVDKDPTKVNFVSLTHRLFEDGISTRKDVSYSFGVLNCAVSKVKNDNRVEWTPYSYPLSANWISHPDWRRRISQQVVYNVPLKDNPDVSVEKSFPKFYSIATKPLENISRNLPIRSRLMFDDMEGAALAGWKDLNSLRMYQSVYTTFEDGLSNADVHLINGMESFTRSDKIIKENFEHNFGYPLYPITKEGTDTEPAQAGGTDGGDTPKDKKKPTPAQEMELAYSNRGNVTKNAEDSSKDTSVQGTGKQYYDESTGKTTVKNADKVLGTAPETADTANGTGICQKNPPLFGGPHSPFSSPLTTQSYMEPSNVNLRDIPRIAPDERFFKDPMGITSGVSDSNKPNFKGAEKYYSQAGQFGNEDVRAYEHSFKDGQDWLRRGINDYTMDTATYTSEVYGVYTPHWVSDGQDQYGYSTGHYEYPTYDSSGLYIHYTGGYSSWTVEEYLDRDEFWAWIWTPYYGRYSQYSTVYWSSYDDCYIGIAHYTGRRGYVIKTQTVQYKKYRLHNMPFLHWYVVKVNHNVVKGYKRVSRRRRGFWGFFGFRTYVTVAITEGEEDWELKCPDWVKEEKLALIKSGNDFSGDDDYYPFYKTWNEAEVINKMIDIAGGKNSEANLIFLEGNDSNWSRRRYGPRNIFRLTCKHKEYTFTYKVKKSRKVGCDWYDYYEFEKGYADYISVDPNSTTAQFCGTWNWDTFSNINATDLNNFLEESTVKTNSPGKTEIMDWMDCKHYLYRWFPYLNQNDQVGWSYEGMEGYGLLSYIPGTDPFKVEDPFPKINFRHYLTIPGGESNEDKPFQDIRLTTTTTDWLTYGSEKYHGRDYFFPNGCVSVNSYYYMDWALSKCWIKACTSGTFYINEQFNGPPTEKIYPQLGHFYKVGIDTPYRVFYFQLKYQLSYLKAVYDLFSAHIDPNSATKDGEPINGKLGDINQEYVIDFETLAEEIDCTGGKVGVCGQRSWSLADPINTIIRDPDDPKSYINKCQIYGFNQWLKLARQFFTKENARQTHIDFLKQLESRIAVFNHTISFFEKFIELSPELMSLSYLKEAEKQIISLVDKEQNTVDNMLVEEVLLAYLNVLYEYRRFFVNKRCNKQDGPLWLMRSLESVVPMALNSLNIKGPTKDDPKSPINNKDGYDVAFTTPEMPYKVRQDLYSKGLLNESKLLEIEKIKKLYIKAQQATKEEYELDHKKLLNGEISEPNIIKARRWDWRRGKKDMISCDPITKEPIRQMYGDFVYYHKPKNGKYRLENTTYLDWKSNLSKAQQKGDDLLAKALEANKVDEAIWDIKFGLPYTTISNEKGATDIIYDVKSYFELSQLTGILDKSLAQDATCRSLKGLDYWEITITCELPLQKFYMPGTGLKIVPYIEPKIIKGGKGPDGKPKPNKEVPIITYKSTPLNITGGTVTPIVETTEYQVPTADQLIGGLVGENGVFKEKK